MSNKVDYYVAWVPATIWSGGQVRHLKTQRNCDKNSAIDLLVELIERIAEQISDSNCTTKEDIWFESIKTLLTLTALRLAHPAADWQEILAALTETQTAVPSSDKDSGILENIDFILRDVFSKLPEDLQRNNKELALSAVYELILNLVPHLDRSIDGNPRLKAVKLEKHRKRKGSFYSPQSVVSLLVEKALTPLLIDQHGNQKSPDQILSLTIVDPAMGAGIFLTSAYKFLQSHARSAPGTQSHARSAPGTAGVPPASTSQIAEIRSDLNVSLAQCLYGVDLDPLAVEIARLSLWLAVADFTLNPAKAFPNLRVGNSLVGCRGDQDLTFPRAALQRKDLKALKKKLPNLHAAKPDTWCAYWFMSKSDLLLSEQQIEFDKAIDRIVDCHKFFHWDSEFPEVFNTAQPGFDAVLGNPPWEIEKPNSREFFGMVAREYWSMGKQEALNKQQELLQSHPELNEAWQARLRDHDAMSNWIKANFQHQGGGDINLYKIFIEHSYNLAREGGSIALIVPSGIYSDSGTRDLRKLLLYKNRWTLLIGFENVDGAFDIHRSFKYCAIALQKGETTDRLKVSFRYDRSRKQGGLERWCEYDTNAISSVSPKWLVVPEVESRATLSLMQRIYDGAETLGSIKYGGERIEYTRELDMTIDSKLFELRERLEKRGFVQDLYGNWLSGNWQKTVDTAHGVVASACGQFQISLDSIKDVYVPLYEGRMVGQFTCNDKHWLEGKGRQAVWQRPQQPGLGPQYLVPLNVLRERCKTGQLKVGFLAVGSATNTRTMIATCLTDVACGNSVPVLTLNQQTFLSLSSDQYLLGLTACLNSLVFDYVIRRKMAGNNLNFFVVEECPIPRLNNANLFLWERIANLAGHLALGHPRFCRQLLDLGYQSIASPDETTIRTIRAYLDILVSMLYNLSYEDIRHMLATDIAHFAADATESVIALQHLFSEARLGSFSLNAKGFFRIDKDLPLTQRLPTRVLLLAKQTAAMGQTSFLSQVDELIKELHQRHENQAQALKAHCSILSELIGSGALDYSYDMRT